MGGIPVGVSLLDEMIQHLIRNARHRSLDHAFPVTPALAGLDEGQEFVGEFPATSRVANKDDINFLRPSGAHIVFLLTEFMGSFRLDRT